MAKVEMLNGDTTPVVFCNRLTEISDDIKDIAVILNFKNGETHVFNTTMKNRDMAWFRWFFDQEFRPISTEE
jgi:hypothetical protein